MMEGLFFVVGWMLAGALIAWWGVWPFVGRSLTGAGVVACVPGLSWLVVAALGLAGPAASLELRVGGGAVVDLGPAFTAVAVASLSGVLAVWLVGFVALRSASPSRPLAVGALLLLGLVVRPGTVDASFLWGLLAVGVPGALDPTLSVLLVLACGATAALGARAPRRLVRAVLSRRLRPSPAQSLPWVAGAVLLVPALPVVGLAAALAVLLFVPPLAVVTRPRGRALAAWSAGLGAVVGCVAGLGGLLGVPGGALAVLVVAVGGVLPRRPRSLVEGGGS